MEFFTPELRSILDWSEECNSEFRVIWSFHSQTPGYFGLECRLVLAKYPGYHVHNNGEIKSFIYLL